MRHAWIALGLLLVAAPARAVDNTSHVLGLGALGAIIRWTAMAFDPPAAVLPALQCLHALSFGATHLGAMHCLSRIAANRLGATAQGDFAAVQSVIFAGAMGLSGVLVQAYGSLAYIAMVVAAASGGVIALAARRYWRDPGTI